MAGGFLQTINKLFYVGNLERLRTTLLPRERELIFHVPEFINNNVNGLLVPPNDPAKLAEGICFALRNDHYKTWVQHINNNEEENLWSRNTEILLHAYAS